MSQQHLSFSKIYLSSIVEIVFGYLTAHQITPPMEGRRTTWLWQSRRGTYKIETPRFVQAKLINPIIKVGGKME